MSDVQRDKLASEIAKSALGISWWDTETAARRVAEKAAEWMMSYSAKDKSQVAQIESLKKKNDELVEYLREAEEYGQQMLIERDELQRIVDHAGHEILRMLRDLREYEAKRNQPDGSN